MRWIVYMTFVLALGAVSAKAADTFTVTTIISAQRAADDMARTGILRHCGRANGMREGIGFSSSSAEEAVRSCCFYQDAMRGRYRIVEKGVARGPRGWFAVVRYQ